MGWGNGIGIGWPNASAGISYAKKLIKAFKERVLSYPNSVFEAEGCLDVTLAELNAIGLLKQTSLVITPNAYNEGVLYDVVPNTPLGDMDVVRATTATRVNELGLIEVVPRNLLTYSNDFSNGSWFPYNSSIIPNNYVSPNGNLIASKIVESSNLSQHALIQALNITSNQPITVSMYLKMDGRNSALIAIFDSVYTNSFSTVFDLQNGTVISSATNGTGIILNSTITNVGDGWYRCSVTGSISSVTSINQVTYIAKDFDTFYLGDGVSGILVYGTQLEQGTVATEYFPTTTRLNIPRLDYSNGSCPSLLVEPQRTNLLTYSNDFNNGVWNTARLSISNNSLSPDGTLNASGMVEDFTNNSHVIYRFITTSNASIYTVSLFVKMGSRRYFKINAVNGGSEVYYDLQNKTTTGGGSIIDFDNGWLKLIYTYTTNSINGEIYFEPSIDGITSNYLGNGSTAAYIYGAQLEQGSYPTSYIPTVASSVTRNADIISKTGISSLIGQTEGTIFIQADNKILGQTNRTLFYVSDATANNFITVNYTAAQADTIRFFVLANGGVGALTFIINTAPVVKIAVSYKNGVNKIFINGLLIYTQTGASFSSNLEGVFLGNNNISNEPLGERINSLQIYKTELTSTECLALTTI
jgi:hypothetical protein